MRRGDLRSIEGAIIGFAIAVGVLAVIAAFAGFVYLIFNVFGPAGILATGFALFVIIPTVMGYFGWFD